jgi:hypothetical protein
VRGGGAHDGGVRSRRDGSRCDGRRPHESCGCVRHTHCAAPIQSGGRVGLRRRYHRAWGVPRHLPRRQQRRRGGGGDAFRHREAPVRPWRGTVRGPRVVQRAGRLRGRFATGCWGAGGGGGGGGGGARITHPSSSDCQYTYRRRSGHDGVRHRAAAFRVRGVLGGGQDTFQDGGSLRAGSHSDGCTGA